MPPTFDELKTRAAAWLAPIPGPSPAGSPATLEAAYQEVRNELAKLDAPTGGTVDWKGVAQKAGLLLETRTKDLLLASFLAHALHVNGGADGLATGAALLAEMMERYWDTMQPDVKRARARANSLAWFLEKTGLSLAAAGSVPPPEQIEAVEVGVGRLAEVARARLADASPAFGPMLEAVARWKPAPEPERKEPPAAPPAGGQAAAPAAATLAVPSSAAEAAEILPRLGSALVEAARLLREAASSDPTAYRILRVGLWLHLDAPPSASAGRTAVPPPPEPLRKQVALLAQNQQWAALLEEAESALPRHRFALDLQRASWQALAGLGAAHERAREAVAVEVRGLLARMPQLPELAFADGSPFAAPETRAWLEEVVLPRAAGQARPVAAAEGGGERAARLAEARQLLAGGRPAEALAGMQEAVLSGTSGRERYLLRLELARACAAAGLTALAKGTFEELAREAAAHGLDVWEPRLAAGTLKGLITTSRALSNDPRGAVPLAEHYRRLCALDPSAAHEVWP